MWWPVLNSDIRLYRGRWCFRTEKPLSLSLKQTATMTAYPRVFRASACAFTTTERTLTSVVTSIAAFHACYSETIRCRLPNALTCCELLTPASRIFCNQSNHTPVCSVAGKTHSPCLRIIRPLATSDHRLHLI